MTHAVNLLPWRAERRRRERLRVLLLIAGAPLLAALVAGGAWLQLAAWQSAQAERNDYLERAIGEVEERLDEVTRLREERERIEQRMAVLEGLVVRRAQPLRWLNGLVDAVPEAVVIDSLRVHQGAMEVVGEARANDAISLFMNSLERAAAFRAPRLEFIEETGEDAYRFRLHVPLRGTTGTGEGTDGPE
ncbi:Tfp pilus assembly protein PilN [Thiohalospira halophila DSM 15071]|uniref:Tfp pilus assembly protein PilN n=1 Tax=Thiohalospira halophila DSM 15071 TaxID=1123397 RepID=A0A1I1TC97_9GAMM|nr:PilN domain-containing protein [Thiohalospira halophila]SFD56254.1 Tfp pilus assembly protein PilN [Thiohalospira halophila DSM 15071]